ncbi:hypothetical protein, partial [Salmonella sp. s51228]|uniref:hypothetical protein n=1 Tax=Salmonella sp. s51228 TaxID=3159652 RepID=UPI0039810219
WLLRVHLLDLVRFLNHSAAMTIVDYTAILHHAAFYPLFCSDFASDHKMSFKRTTAQQETLSQFVSIQANLYGMAAPSN